MKMKDLLKNIMLFVLPYIQELIASKVVPALKRKGYERLNDLVNDRLEDLANLVDKIKAETNEVKREAHLEGFRLGIKTLRAISKTITDACNKLEEIVG